MVTRCEHAQESRCFHGKNQSGKEEAALSEGVVHAAGMECGKHELSSVVSWGKGRRLYGRAADFVRSPDIRVGGQQQRLFLLLQSSRDFSATATYLKHFACGFFTSR